MIYFSPGSSNQIQTKDPAKKFILWKLGNKSSNIASTRYRCLMPIRWLINESGPRHVLIDDRDLYPPLERVAAIVFVKSFGLRDLTLARRAFDRKIPIIIDICDNVFFGPKGSFYANNLRALAPLAQQIITTNDELAKTIKNTLGEVCPPMTCIEDAVESEADRDFCDLYQRGHFPFLNIKWREAVRLNLTVRIKNRNSDSLARSLGINRHWLTVQQNQIRTFFAKVRNRLTSSASQFRTCFTKLFRKQREQVSPSAERLPKILWFGVSGVPGVHGITDILTLKNDLERLHQSRPFELVVCTNSRKLFEQHLSTLKLMLTFVQWSPENLSRAVQDSDVIIVPNPMNEFTRVKSANRTLLALEFGKPVVATLTSALQPLKGLVYFSDWERNIQKALNEDSKEKQARVAAWKAMRVRFESHNNAKHWFNLLPVECRSSEEGRMAGKNHFQVLLNQEI